jgi:hypothetical protein
MANINDTKDNEKKKENFIYLVERKRNKKKMKYNKYIEKIFSK